MAKRSLPNPPGSFRAHVSSTAVARLAGVSQSSVSRVFTPGAAVSAAVRERVLKAATDLNYRPNALPAILQTGRSGLIAVLVGGFGNPFYTEFLRCVTSILRERRLETILVHTDSSENLDELVGELSRYRIDGVISALAIRLPRIARTLERAGIPVVALNSDPVGQIRTVSSNNRSAGALAADLLVQRGGRQLAYLASREGPSQQQRQRGFLKRLSDLGMPLPEVVLAGASYEQGYAATVQLLSAKQRPDGIFAVNDVVAMGALDAIRHEFKLSVPEDVQLIGFDDIPMASWRGIDLTTFHQDIEALASAAADLLADDPPAASVTIAPRLVLRGTTRSPGSAEIAGN